MTDTQAGLLPCKCGAELIGVSDGSSVYGWQCSTCKRAWPRTATERSKWKIESLNKINEGAQGPFSGASPSPPASAEVDALASKLAAYQLGSWFECNTVDEMQGFYLSRLPAIRDAAKACGYAIGLHGSTRRDMDLIAVPWRDGYSPRDELARAIQLAACGITMASHTWEQKPAGRWAVSLPICWTNWHDMIGAGHIDLSVMATEASGAAVQVPEVTDPMLERLERRCHAAEMRNESDVLIDTRDLRAMLAAAPER